MCVKNKWHLKILAALLALYAFIALVPLSESEPPRAHAARAPEEAPASEPRVTPVVPVPRPERRPDPPAAIAANVARARERPLAQQSSVTNEAADDEPEVFDGPPPDPFVDQKITAVREQWERESDDLEWSKKAREETIALFAKQQLPEELLHDVRCRRTVCRIAVDATDPMRMAGLAQHLQDKVPDAYFSVIEDEAFAYVPR
jgi:hypothetical protein